MRTRRMSQITDGTAQTDRFPAALDDHYFDVDERSTQELIAQTFQYAKSVHFYRVAHEKVIRDGDWGKLFASDQAVIMSDILATDSARMEAEFLPLMAPGRRPADAARYLIGFARRIDSWYTGLIEADDKFAGVLGKHIGTMVVEKLSPFLHDVMRTLQPHGENQLSVGNLDLRHGFHEIWNNHIDDTETETDPQTLLHSTFYSLVSAVSNLKPIAEELLRREWKSQRHEPAMALVLAFTKLFGQAQTAMNRFTGRHRDFYYQNVLGLQPRLAIADSTFLVLNSSAGGVSLSIPAGTEFSAGKVNGKEIVYASDADMTVTDAQVRDLRTLFCSRDPQISPEIRLHYVCAVRMAQIPAAADPGTPVVSWPLFGADKPQAEMSSGQDADIGFAIASSTLQLREGHRKIVVNVSFRIPPALDQVPPGPDADAIALGAAVRRKILEQQSSLMREQMTALDRFDRNNLLGQNPEYLFQRVMGEAFLVDITTGAGWREIGDYEVLPASGKADGARRLVFTFTFGPDAPAVAGCNPDVHGAGFATKLPVLRFRVNPRASIYPYSLLRDVEVDEITVDSEVSDAIRNVAWNQNGQLETTKPFAPFGPIPTSNSYLIVGNYEAARVNLTEFTVNLEWGELPDTPGGFKEYYTGYKTTYDNDGFRATASVLRDGRWRPAQGEPAQVVTLFDIDQAEGEIVASPRRIPITVLEYFKRLDPTVTEEQFRYDQKSRNGFFRLALTGSEAGFGHAEYPTLLSETLTENALRARRFRRRPLPLPNSPYTPVVNRLSFAYKAQSTIRAGAPPDISNPYAEKIYYIRPFGISTVNTSKAWTLLPVYDQDGSLLIGFSASEPSGVLTLLFHLREDSVTDLAAARSTVSWFYLASDEWKPLSEFQLLSDTTEGFLASGIVTLQLPDDITKDNTLMPPNLYWLRVSANQNLQSFCSVYSVRTQAVSVTRKAAPIAGFTKALPPGSISGPVQSIPGLQLVVQPLASRGGREPETPHQLITRASERLRHKCRASTPWDYERLVLENFPEVFKVKCFPAMSSKYGIRPAPGTVLVVVVPQQAEHTSERVFDPMLNANQLMRIQGLLTISSPQASIEVRNPVYERILIRCAVLFQSDAAREKGKSLNRLNQAIIDYISPWSGVGAPFRFGWSFRKEEVEAYLRKLPYVQSVTRFSMLHITHGGQSGYQLEDTARRFSLESVNKLTPRFPWSLAIPNAQNILETIHRKPPLPAEATGMGYLTIGNTFIVAGENPHGKTEQGNS